MSRQPTPRLSGLATSGIALGLLIAGSAAGTTAVAAAPSLPAGAPVPGAPRPESRVAPSMVGLVVNLPAHRLDVVVDGWRIASYPVAVGPPDAPTPTGRFRIGSVTVPVGGASVPPAGAPPATDDEADPAAILHVETLGAVLATRGDGELARSTPRAGLRLRSSDLRAVASTLERYAGGVPVERSAAGADQRRTREVALPTPVPLDLVYETVEIRDGRLEVHVDLYGRGGAPLSRRVTEVLRREGYEADRVNPYAVAHLAARKAPLVVPLARLLLPPGPMAGLPGTNPTADRTAQGPRRASTSRRTPGSVRSARWLIPSTVTASAPRR